MSALSNYLEGKIIDHFLRNVPVSSPTEIYLALFESDPTDAGTGTETSYDGYARQLSTWGAPVDGLTRNTSLITFPANGNASADVILTHGALFDAVSGGNMFIHGPLATPKTVAVGELLFFAVDALGFQLN